MPRRWGIGISLPCPLTSRFIAAEHVYLRSVILGANDRKPLPPDKQTGANVQITGPKGDVVATLGASVEESVAACAWNVPEDAAGGQYTATISFPWAGFPPT